MGNHPESRLMLRSGVVPVSVLMSRLLTGYAARFNRKYRRHGQLFQNRPTRNAAQSESGGYKSILCQEDPYLRELVRYIHLNPLRTNLAGDMDELDRYPWCGHPVLAGMGKRKHPWQNIDCVYGLFSDVEVMGIRPDEVTAFGKSPRTVTARSLVCFWAHRKLGMTTVQIAPRVGIGQPSVSRSSMKGEKIAGENQLELLEDNRIKE